MAARLLCIYPEEETPTPTHNILHDCRTIRAKAVQAFDIRKIRHDVYLNRSIMRSECRNSRSIISRWDEMMWSCSSEHEFGVKDIVA